MEHYFCPFCSLVYSEFHVLQRKSIGHILISRNSLQSPLPWSYITLFDLSSLATQYLHWEFAPAIVLLRRSKLGDRGESGESIFLSATPCSRHYYQSEYKENRSSLGKKRLANWNASLQAEYFFHLSISTNFHRLEFATLLCKLRTWSRIILNVVPSKLKLLSGETLLFLHSSNQETPGFVVETKFDLIIAELFCSFTSSGVS